MSRRERLRAELERCATALRELASENEPDGDSASFAEALPALVGLLHAGAGAAANAAWAISKLTSMSHSPRLASENKVSIRQAGGVHPLVKLLDNGSDAKASSAAAGALQNIASHNTNFAEAVLAAISVNAPKLEQHPYLVERLKPVATKRMRRLEGGVDANALSKAISDAEMVHVEPSSLEYARKRCEELPAHLEKRREALGIGGVDTPSDFCCPITHEVMVEPVVASDGHSYEREALMEILGGTKLSPLTREPLEDVICPNHTLLKRIRGYDEEVLKLVERSTKSRGIFLEAS